MPLARLGLGLCLALSGVLAGETAAWAEPTATATSAPTGSEAVVVLVGAAGRDPELRPLLSELLERHGVRARISEQSGFGREELLHAAPSSGVFVFVVPGREGNVGLYFRAPDGERFLLRSVLLRAGFDDLGRELVGQVVETAVVALLESGAGLTREQAQLALSRDDSGAAPAAPGEAPASPTPPPPVRTAPKPVPQKRAATPLTELEGWLALRYGAVALGNELGVAHGPGLELGLGAKRSWLLRGRLSAERDFPHSFETSLIAAELTRVRLRFVVDAGLPLTRWQTLLLSLGIGQDRVNVKPTAPAGSDVAPVPAFADNAAMAQAELRYELALGVVRVAAAVGADFSLVETHYDVAHPIERERERVVRPWLVRPGAAMTLAFCPHWASF